MNEVASLEQLHLVKEAELNNLKIAIEKDQLIIAQLRSMIEKRKHINLNHLIN